MALPIDIPLPSLTFFSALASPAVGFFLASLYLKKPLQDVERLLMSIIIIILWICADVDYYLLFKDHQFKFIYLDDYWITPQHHHITSRAVV